MHAELAVGLELLLVKKLIQGCLVGKFRMIGAVSLDELRLVAGDG